MFIYLITFALSYVLLRIGQNKKNKFQRKVCIIMALILPSILAGCRDYSIGTDVLIYGNRWFRFAVTSQQNFIEYIRWAMASSIGAVYAGLNYFVAMFTENTHWFYFFLSLLTNSLVYKAVKDNDDLVDVPFAMLTYYILFYNQSLNLLRQSLAVAFGVCAFIYIRRQKKIPFIICTALAIFTHSSAIVIIAVYIVYIAINGKFGTIAKIGILIGAGISVIGFASITQILIQIGILSNRYEHYIYDVQRGGGYVRLFLLCVPYLILLLFCTKKTEFEKEKNALVILLAMASLLSFLAFRLAHIARIAIYFDIYLVFSVPYIVQNCKYTIRARRKNLNQLFLVCFMLAYWILVYVIRQGGETVPYIFMT